MDEKALALLERIAKAVEFLASYHGGTFEPAQPAPALAPEPTEQTGEANTQKASE
jgi:hypothetical protein